MKIGRVTFIDPTQSEAKRALIGAEVDKVIGNLFRDPSELVTLAIPPEPEQLRAALIRLCDVENCALVLTTTPTGPAEGDFTPDVTREVVERSLPGFGEVIRMYSYEKSKVSILSRMEAGARGKSLILNLPSRPKPIRYCLRIIDAAICEALVQIAGQKPVLRGDEVVIPMEKWVPFLKHFRTKPDPRREHDPL